MSNYCKDKGIYCEFATDLGFCSVTGCRKESRVSKEHEENTCRLGWWKIWYMGFGSDPMFTYTCSECGHDADKDYNYCPECGALMQKELKE